MAEPFGLAPGMDEGAEAEAARAAAALRLRRSVIPPEGRQEGAATRAIELLGRLHPANLVAGAYHLAQNTAGNLDHYLENELAGDTGLADNAAGIATMLTLGGVGRIPRRVQPQPELAAPEVAAPRAPGIDPLTNKPYTTITDAVQARMEARSNRAAPPSSEPAQGPLRAISSAEPQLSEPIRKVGPTEGNVTKLNQGGRPSFLSGFLGGREPTGRLVDRLSRPSWEMEQPPVPSARLEDAYMRGELSPPAPPRAALPQADIPSRAPDFLNRRQPEQPQLPAPSPMDMRASQPSAAEITALTPPQRWYHGAKTEFDKFDVNKGFELKGEPDRAAAFTTDPELASQYAQQYNTKKPPGPIIEANLQWKNPKVIEQQDWGTRGQQATQIEKAKADGHDGIIFKYKSGQQEALVFNDKDVGILAKHRSLAAAKAVEQRMREMQLRQELDQAFGSLAPRK